MVGLLKFSNLKIIFDCGKDDFFFDVNNIFHQKLLVNNIEHIYNIKEGEHNWKYWNISIFEHLNYFSNFFNNTL
jgi:S-formylglutathione hydrolase FrmB